MCNEKWVCECTCICDPSGPKSCNICFIFVPLGPHSAEFQRCKIWGRKYSKIFICAKKRMSYVEYFIVSTPLIYCITCAMKACLKTKRCETLATTQYGKCCRFHYFIFFVFHTLATSHRIASYHLDRKVS